MYPKIEIKKGEWELENNIIQDYVILIDINRISIFNNVTNEIEEIEFLDNIKSNYDIKEIANKIKSRTLQ